VARPASARSALISRSIWETAPIMARKQRQVAVEVSIFSRKDTSSTCFYFSVFTISRRCTKDRRHAAKFSHHERILVSDIAQQLIPAGSVDFSPTDFAGKNACATRGCKPKKGNLPLAFFATELYYVYNNPNPGSAENSPFGQITKTTSIS
jgi:hypothetical protein